MVTTVLGPCVAVTFFSARLKRGAICHAMLPEPRSNGRSDFWETPEKYVSCAVEKLIQSFQGSAAASDVEVKIFGGAHLLPGRGKTKSTSVGAANVALARELLAAAGYTITASDTGGTFGRKVVFNTQSGSVHVKRLNRTQTGADAHRGE